ncbi:metalloregulator ArsR/SmtB family transcription factor [Mycobacterium sp. NPDC050441]|uniref:ArsR/SmtB family transcription factor n=1 Tax=Mycobacterium sp. NPDC050441 TaxID=3155403 RepID=UPI0033CCBF0E
MHESASPVQVFAALADDSRWQVLVALGRRPASASSLADELPISRQAIAKHLKVLTDVGLVSATRVGREIRYEAVGARLSEVARRLDGIAAGWERRLARIKDVVERDGSSQIPQ